MIQVVESPLVVLLVYLKQEIPRQLAFWFQQG